MLAKILSLILSFLMVFTSAPVDADLVKDAAKGISDGVSGVVSDGADLLSGGYSALSGLFKKIAQYISGLDTANKPDAGIVSGDTADKAVKSVMSNSEPKLQTQAGTTYTVTGAKIESDYASGYGFDYSKNASVKITVTSTSTFKDAIFPFDIAVEPYKRGDDLPSTGASVSIPGPYFTFNSFKVLFPDREITSNTSTVTINKDFIGTVYVYVYSFQPLTATKIKGVEIDNYTGTIAPNPEQTFTYYMAPTVSFNSHGGSTLSDIINPVVNLPSPGTKTGYTFKGWYTSASNNTRVGGIGTNYNPTAPITLHAQWTANTNTAYTVEHYVMGTNGAYPATATKTVNKTGTTAATLTLANLKDTTLEVTNGIAYSYGQVGGTTATTTTIAADGTRVIKLYYSRSDYALTLSKGTGISAVSGAGTYYYGQSVNIDATVATGYTWSKWSDNDTTKARTYIMPAAATTLTASATANTNTAYTVEHYVMGTNGANPATATKTENKTGTTAASLTLANLKDTTLEVTNGIAYSYGQVGGTTATTTTIAADGTRVIKLYYVRSQYALTLSEGTGISAVSGAGTYYYGQSVSIDATVATGYTWSKWSDNDTTKARSYTMPAAATTLTASATANTNTAYTVEHYVMGTNGAYPATATKTENKTGTTAASLTLANLKDTTLEVTNGIAYSYGKVGESTETTTTIAADGTRVIKLYYVRSQYALTLSKGTGISAVSGAGTYYYGQSVSIDATVATGYTWSKWSDNDTTKARTYIMPAAATTLTASATANTYTVKYYLDGVEQTSLQQTCNYGTNYEYQSVPGKTGYQVSGWWTGSTASNKGTQYAAGTSFSNLTTTNGATVNRYAYSTPNENTAYTVEHYVMGTDGEYPTTLIDEYIDNLTGETGATLTLSNLKRGGLEVANGIAYSYGKVGESTETTTTIAADGSTVIKLYYVRSQYALTLSEGTGISAVSGAGTYYYGQSVSIDATVATGYTWSKWSDNDTTKARSYTMPAAATTLTASATVNTYTVKYYLDGVEQTSLEQACTYGASYNYPSVPEKIGYQVSGWWTGSTASNKGTQYAAGTSFSNLTTTDGATVNRYAYSTPNENTAYTVEHYVMGTDGKYPTEATATDNLTGTTGATLTLNTLKDPNKNIEVTNGIAYSYGQVGETTVTTTTIAADGSTVIKLYYSRSKYALTLSNGTGISAVSGAGTYYYGQSVSINATVATGYTWSKWSDNDTTKARTYTMPAAATTLTANATATKYTISYNLDGGSVATENKTEYNITTDSFTLNNPTKTGYTFAGWTGTGLSSASTSVTITKGSTGNRSYTATWTLNAPTIKTHPAAQTATEGYTTTTAPQMSVAVTAVSGLTYTYQWYENTTNSTTGAKAVSGATSAALTLPTGKTEGTYYYYCVVTVTDDDTQTNTATSNTASFTVGAPSFSLTVDKVTNDAGIDTATGSVTSAVRNTSVTVEATLKEGYEFVGWYDNASGEGTAKSTNTTYTFNLTADTTLYAKSKAKTYTITYYKNDGTGTGEKETEDKTYGEDYTIKDGSIFTRTGYTFNGWNTADNGSGTPYDAGANYTDNAALTLYAQWKQNKCKVTLYANDGTGNKSTKEVDPGATYGVLAQMLPTPVYEGHIFDGWYTEGGTNISEISDEHITEDIDIFAHWKKGCVVNVSVACGSLTVEIDGETVSSDAQFNGRYPIGTEVTVTANPPTNGTFLFWYEKVTSNDEKGKIVSYDSEYAFDLGENVYLSAVCATYGKPLIVFVDTLANKMFASGLKESTSYPTAPTHPGHAFSGWSIKNVDGNVIAYANYTITTDAKIYKVTLDGPGSISFNKLAPTPEGGDESATYTYFDTKVTVSVTDDEISQNGGNFRGWSFDGSKGKIISYSKTYSFYAYRDTTITPVFDTAVTPEPVIQLTAVTELGDHDNPNNPVTGTFMATRTVPDGYIYVTSGILYTNKQESGNYDSMVLENVDGTNVIQKKASFDAGNAQAKLDINAKPGRVYYGRGYMTVLNSDNELEVIYTDIVRMVIGSQKEGAISVVKKPNS